MQILTEYFLANLGTNMTYTITALIIAIIFVLTLEKYFKIVLKPAYIHFPNRQPNIKILKMKNPMRRN